MCIERKVTNITLYMNMEALCIWVCMKWIILHVEVTREQNIVRAVSFHFYKSFSLYHLCISLCLVALLSCSISVERAICICSALNTFLDPLEMYYVRSYIAGRQHHRLRKKRTEPSQNWRQRRRNKNSTNNNNNIT